ncbi:hypothetical protein CSPB12327_07725 [Campylobacter sp. RM12327]|uniref:hypothetical protein n=1 Tax=Campylobacter sputorum TaxID=206 RepID=UPI000B7940EC|nr:MULTISPECIES: hypothetical protein [Campylobacter]ASM39452.1 hypothetical protein CSPB_0187 [Campylobacter sputorum]MBE7358833.1 hypothetical protein [Campylobacter sp. RM11302]MBF6670023.1 hypothetical protein [Campylobacter sp. RM12327]MBF6678422.1 hypothetical protein [Campylobacter sp. RM11259]
MKDSIICFLIAVFVIGCTISAKTPSRVILDDNKVIIDDGHHNGNGKFCPPGKLKKAIANLSGSKAIFYL